jgi:hypothetical protein
VIKANDQWCERHWKPYKDGERNGVFASLALMQAFIDSPMVTELTDKSTAALNKAMKGDKPVCCRLGETVMGEILRKAKELKP